MLRVESMCKTPVFCGYSIVVIHDLAKVKSRVRVSLPAPEINMENKISIVVPTMWKFQPFLDFLVDLVQLEIIDEIHVINNNIAETPIHAALSHHKIIVHNFDKNIFVNAAFNFGVAVAKNNFIALMNDDVIFDLKAFYRAASILKPLTMVALSPCSDLTKNVSGEAKLVKFEVGMEAFHFGSCMFIHKHDWIDIPAGIDLYYGDNWIWDTLVTRGGEVYLIKDVFFSSPTSVTSSNFYTPMWLGREGHIFEHTIAHFKQRYQK